MTIAARARDRWPGLALAAALCCPTAGAAISPERSIRSLTQDVIDDRFGLPQNSVRALLHASSGDLWLATDEGLARYDGEGVAAVPRDGALALPSSLPTSLVETADGTLWVGTQDAGLHRLRGGRFERFPLPGTTPSVNVRSLRLAPDGALWAATMVGAFRIAGEEARAYTMAGGLPDDRVKCVEVARDGATWIGTRRGLVILEGGRLRPGPAPFRDTPIYALAADPTGGVWVAGARGGVSLEGGGDPRRAAAARAFTDGVTALLVDRDGTLWIATQDHGLARLAGDGLERYRAADGLPDDLTAALHEDREGSVWIGSQQGGAVRLRQGAFQVLGARDGLGSDAVTAVLQARGGDVWVGSGIGVDVLPRGVPPARRVATCSVMALLEDRDGAIWIGTVDQGLWRWRGGAVEKLTAGLPPNTWIRSLVQDAEGVIWAGTTSGLFRVRGGALEPVTEGLPVERQQVTAMAVSARGEHFVATEGAGVYRRGGQRFLPEAGGPAAPGLVVGLTADGDGTMWLATQGGGLWRRRGGTYAGLTSRRGLPTDTFYAVLDDGRGALWTTGNRGIQQWPRVGLEAALEGRTGAPPGRTWTVADGLRGNECSGGSTPGAWRTRDGRLWFAMVRGLAVIDPASAEPVAPAPAVAIRQVLVDGRSLPVGAPLVLEPEARRLEIAYGARVLLGQREAWFRHRLIGAEDGWSEPRRERALQYTFLPPGRYRLEVQARLGSGPWGDPTSVEMEQRPPAWRSPVVVAAAILALAAAAAGLFLAGRRSAGRR